MSDTPADGQFVQRQPVIVMPPVRKLFGVFAPPAVDPDYVSPALRITARVEGHCRAGLKHTAAAVVYPSGRFNNIQVAQLKADRQLIVDEVGEDGKIAVAFDPDHTEAQLRAHLAHDPESLVALVRQVLPDMLAPLQTVEVSQIGAGGAPNSTTVTVQTAEGTASAPGAADGSTAADQPPPPPAGVSAAAGKPAKGAAT
jgi:hypothetical protein